MVSEIERRKEEHIRVHLETDVLATRNAWDDVHLRHEALPTIDLDQVQTQITLLGRKLQSPLLLSGMTGGAPAAKEINNRLAEVAANYGLALGVGSQRVALEHPGQVSSFSVILNHDVPMRIANLGLPQLIKYGENGPAMAEKCVEMIDAHAIAIHLNSLQEAVQMEGEPIGTGSEDAISRLSDELSTPIIAKETGAGIDGRTAQRLIALGVSCIDTGGSGGTSFSAVEAARATQENHPIASVGELLRDWGNPAPDCVRSVRKIDSEIPLIASGGIRHGLDVVRALSLGADAAGMAGAALRPAAKSKADLDDFVSFSLQAFKIGCFLSGWKMPLRRGN